jgi:hypothetical protein
MQQGVVGGDIIKSITYGIVVFSIIITSVLVLLLEKTPLPNRFARILTPEWPWFRRKRVAEGVAEAVVEEKAPEPAPVKKSRRRTKKTNIKDKE